MYKRQEEEGRRIKGKEQEVFSIMSHVRNGEFFVDQALVSGCSGGLFENIVAMADILKGYGIPGSGPVSYTHLDVYKRQGVLLWGASTMRS